MESCSEFHEKALKLRRLVQDTLWNNDTQFFEVVRPNGQFANVREQLGFVPWCFAIPATNQQSAWAQLTDAKGFSAPFGLTTAERRHPEFRSHGCCKCEWDGAVWPFATSQTLTALANVLRDYPQSSVTKRDYFEALLTYARSQHFDGKPYIGEYLDETTGQWLKGNQERSRYYNHSTFADLIITGLVGLRPKDTDGLELDPLLPVNTWPWFCLDGLRYHDHDLTIIWDQDGSRYKKGPGLSVLVDGKTAGQKTDLGKLVIRHLNVSDR
jgi:hypothetical protein